MPIQSPSDGPSQPMTTLRRVTRRQGPTASRSGFAIISSDSRLPLGLTVGSFWVASGTGLIYTPGVPMALAALAVALRRRLPEDSNNGLSGGHCRKSDPNAARQGQHFPHESPNTAFVRCPPLNRVLLSRTLDGEDDFSGNSTDASPESAPCRDRSRLCPSSRAHEPLHDRRRRSATRSTQPSAIEPRALSFDPNELKIA